jgi:hypothetical protein
VEGGRFKVEGGRWKWKVEGGRWKWKYWSDEINIKISSYGHSSI